VLAGLATLAAIRILYLMVCPLELVPDEAYYWDWSRHLDWGYFSKPPLIAWLIALATTLGGHSEFAIRFPAVLLGTGGLWMTYELGRRLFDHATGVRAVWLVAVAPGTTALCLLMTIDSPFLAAWTAALYCLWRMLERPNPQRRWIGLAILATGIALLSKQTALALFPLTLFYLGTSSADRPKLRQGAVWLWMAGSAAFLIPVLSWNAAHGWVTLQHTSEHFGATFEGTRHLVRLLELVGSQLGLISPLIFGLATLACCSHLWHFRQATPQVRFLLCFGVIPWLGIAGLGTIQRIQPNWPVATHLSSLVLLAAWSTGQISIADRWNVLRLQVWPAILVGMGMTGLLAAMPFLLPRTPLAGTPLDLTQRLRGWRAIGQGVDDRWNQSCRESLLVIAATSRGPVSELAYYLPDQPRVYRWNASETMESQHEIWGGPDDARGRDALILTEGSNPVPARLAAAFASLHELPPVCVTLGNTDRRFRLWHGKDMSHWPAYHPDELRSARMP